MPRPAGAEAALGPQLGTAPALRCPSVTSRCSESQFRVMNASQRIGDLQTWRRPRRKAAGHVGAGGGGPGQVWHPGWLRQGAVVPAESGTPAGSVGAVVPAESGTPAGSVRGRWSRPSLASWLALSPLRGSRVRGVHLQLPLHLKEPPCWAPRLWSQPPAPCLAGSMEDSSPGAEGP